MTALFGKKTEKLQSKKEVKPSLAKAALVKEKRVDFAWQALKSAHITEKATDSTAAGKYIFKVYKKSNKKEVKRAVENIYGVSVVSVNIVNIPSKKRRLGKTQGIKPGYKKAIVTLGAGQKIELIPR